MYSEILVEEILKTNIAPFSVFNDRNCVIDFKCGSKILIAVNVSKEFISIYNCLVVDNELTQSEIDILKQNLVNATVTANHTMSISKVGANGLLVKNIIVSHEKNRDKFHGLDYSSFSSNDLSFVFFRNEITLL